MAVDRVDGAAIRTIAVVALALLTASCGARDGDVLTEWSASDEGSTRTVDHRAWEAFLQKHISVDAAGVNRVAYEAAAAEQRSALSGYLNALSKQDPRELNKAEQLAYWINLYNALTVDVVLQHPGVSSIRQMGEGVAGAGPWGDPAIEVAGRSLSLDDIEHRILRPIFRDHRIHYGVNCASFSCPNLMRTAYTAANVETLLDKAELDYVNHPRAVAFDADGRLTLSSIYDWYRTDFAATERELLNYLSRHHRTEGERLAAYEGTVRYDYDWSLNSVAE